MLRKKHFTSPLISKLEKDLIKGQISSLEEFLKEIEQKGVPLIELFKDDENYKLVTSII